MPNGKEDDGGQTNAYNRQSFGDADAKFDGFEVTSTADVERTREMRNTQKIENPYWRQLLKG